MELRRRVGARDVVRRAEVQLLVLSVVHLAHFPGHDPGKDIVRALEHLPARAEVLAQQHAARLAVLRLRRVAVGEVFLEKNRWVSQTEAVDALLHVADGEEILPIARDGVEDAVLHLVRVLILVDHDLLIARGDLPRQLRGRAVRLRQDLDGIVLLIGEVHGVAAQLLCLIGAGEIRRQTDERAHGRGHLA